MLDCLGELVFLKDKPSSAIKEVSMPNDISPALLHISALDQNSFKIKITRSVNKKLIERQKTYIKFSTLDLG